MAALRSLSVMIGAAVAALGSVLYIAWSRYFPSQRRTRRYLMADTIRHSEENYLDRQILVLGLDGAGKSSIIHAISTNTTRSHSAPTHGFNSAKILSQGLRIELLEVGGSHNLRTYWHQYLTNAHLMVFVVDSTDDIRLCLARHELHRLLEAAPQLPLLVLANKQDRDNALSISNIRTELSLHQTAGQREVTLLGTSAIFDGVGQSTSLQSVRTLLEEKLHTGKEWTPCEVNHDQTSLFQPSLDTNR
ncbi:ADP-ribosylation factor-like protein 10 [Pelobates fuscus]|uniref:ADP-ribosylation factor-like protein 10 n=1 Tax=Pelobates fuscus TaxID=191477 RepID=UPI002FE4EE08